MDTTVWERATAHSAEVDRRESRLVRRVALAAGALLVLLIAGNQLGVTRPVLAFTGSSAGAMTPDTQEATISLDVRNRGLFPERITGLSFDHPGLTIDSAQLRPEPLGSFQEGILDITMTVDCAARIDGVPVWGSEPTPAGDIPVRITTQRPWGPVSKEYDSSGIGPDVAWQLLQTALGACDSWDS